MHKIVSNITILAAIGLVAATSAPTLAASPYGGKPASGLDCSLPANSDNAQCEAVTVHGGPGGKNNRSSAGTATPGVRTDAATMSNTPAGTNGANSNSAGGPPSGSWNWDQRYRDQFHQRFHGFNFGTFGTPTFSIGVGIGVPGSYYHYLRPVQRSIYRYYPWFRGYLYFVGRGGQFVIVSPRSHRIVAVI